MAVVSLSGAVAGFVGCVGDDPTADVTSSPEGGPTTQGNDKKANGATCASGEECGSAQCVDGVCCESACAGTCEACNLPDSLGKCAAVPAGQDPAKECKRLDPLVPDAEADPVDGGDEGGADDGGGGGGGLNVPEGGLEGQEGPCAPTCNGQRACGFPGGETTCGTTFCNDAKQAGRLACDGRGNCTSIELDTCQAYTCGATATAGACKTSCATIDDCQDTHYCSAAGKCEPKKGIGVACGLPTDCQSGYCSGTAGASVCCESECSGDPSTTCTKAGSVGKCVCPECATGPCKLYYKDADGDGYGDRDGKTSDNTAKYGCAAGPIPVGYVDNNKDCYDVNDANGPKVKPGQTDYFDTGYGPTADNYDYNCDGLRTKYYKEYPGEVCHYCNQTLALPGGSGSACTQPTTCSSTSVVSGHSCFGGSGPFVQFCDESVATAFRKIVDCGDPAATLYTCGKCSASGQAPSYTTQSTKQKCH